MRRTIPLLVCASAFLALPLSIRAEEAAVLFTGRTHAMLYPCQCPLEPSGGVTRRATAVKEFAAKNIPYLLVDCGDSFAGGMMDQYALGEELDRRRSEVNLKAMGAMGYDCAALGESELNFGWEFFLQTSRSARVRFVSCNVAAEGISPFIVKKTGNTLIGVTALTPETVQKKIPQSSFISPAQALKETIGRLRGKGCALVVLVSNLSEKESLALIRDVPGVDVLILNQPENENLVSEEKCLVLKSPWQGRRLGEAVFLLEQGRIEKLQFAEVKLLEKMAEDKETAKLVPRCFSDAECLKPGQSGKCVDGGTPSSRCSFTPAQKIRLIVVGAKECLTCNTQSLPAALAKKIPGLEVTEVFYPGPEAEELMKKGAAFTLPAFLLGKELEKEKVFAEMKDSLEPAGEYYRIKPSAAGFGYFANRPRAKDRLDVFLSLFDQDADKLLENLKEFSPVVHFLARKGGAPRGKYEEEEDLRSVCVGKYYPGFFYNYLVCRAADPQSSWWEKCLEGVDTVPVRRCALGEEGARLLEENTALSRELAVEKGPTYLLENREIFGSVNVPSKDELRKILIRE